MRVAAVVLVLVGLTSTRAAAADASEFESKPNAIYAQFGLATPLGLAGLEAERRLSPVFSVSVGAGYGLLGPQIAAMPRVTVGSGPSALVLGIGLSRGKYASSICFDDDSCASISGTPTWVNTEVGGIYRWSGGISFKYFGGFGRTVAGELICGGGAADQCVASHSASGLEIIYTGFAFGQAF
jgi:hypothetical protein